MCSSDRDQILVRLRDAAVGNCYLLFAPNVNRIFVSGMLLPLATHARSPLAHLASLSLSSLATLSLSRSLSLSRYTLSFSLFLAVLFLICTATQSSSARGSQLSGSHEEGGERDITRKSRKANTGVGIHSRAFENEKTNTHGSQSEFDANETTGTGERAYPSSSSLLFFQRLHFSFVFLSSFLVIC